MQLKDNEELQEKLILKAEKKVLKKLGNKLSNAYTFHNQEHTQHVVAQVSRLAKAAQLSTFDTTKLLIAAWFHDVGYLKGAPQHEHRSAKAAKKFLEKHISEAFFISEVCQIITESNLHSLALHPLSFYLKDADLSHLGSDDYDMWFEKLVEEQKNTNTPFDASASNNLKFLKQHQYQTKEGLHFYQEGKEKVIQSLLNAL